MKLLHTADWHVGKTIKGQSRLAEHKAVLADIVRIADTERVDVVLVVGDLYETAAPNPDAEALVLKTLLDLRDTGAQVIVISGNHDNAPRFEAMRPVFAALGVTVMGAPRRPTDGGVVEVSGRDGESIRVALVPFLSQRGIIRTEQLMGQDAGSNIATYDERMRQLVARAVRAVRRRRGERRRCALHGHRRVSSVAASAPRRPTWTTRSARRRSPRTPTTSRSDTSTAPNRSPAPRPIWYSGSPVQVDFGELDDPNNVLLVTATRTTPAVVRPVAVSGGRRLRTLRGTVDQLRALVADTDDSFLRRDRRGADPRRARRGRARAPRGGRRRSAARAEGRGRLDRGAPVAAVGADAARAIRRVPRRRRASTMLVSPRCSPSCSTSRRPDASALAHRRRVHGVPRFRRPSTSPVPTSSRWWARPGRASRACSTRSASPSTASSPATTTTGWSHRRSRRARTRHGSASRSSSAGSEYVATRVVRRTKTGGATTKEARLECGR